MKAFLRIDLDASVLPMALVFVLLSFFSCSRIQPVPPSVTAVKISESTYDSQSVVALVNGVPILRGDIEQDMRTVNMAYEALKETLSEKEIAAKKLEARQQILDRMIEKEIFAQKAEELGLENSETLEAQIAAAHAVAIEKIAGHVRKTYPDLSREELDKQVEMLLKSQGISLEQFRKNTETAVIREHLFDELRGRAEKPGPATVERYYRRLLEEQKIRFDTGNAGYEQALLSGELLVYRPAEYRIIRELYLGFDDDVIGLIRQLKSINSEKEAEAMREDQFIRQEPLVQSVLALLKTKSFTEVAMEYTGGNRQVNYISRDSVRFSQDYKEAALEIPKPGEPGRPVRMEYGTLILYWEGNTQAAGEVPLVEIYDKIESLAYAEEQEAVLVEVRSHWREAADITFFPENLQ